MISTNPQRNREAMWGAAVGGALGYLVPIFLMATALALGMARLKSDVLSVGIDFLPYAAFGALLGLAVGPRSTRARPVALLVVAAFLCCVGGAAMVLSIMVSGMSHSFDGLPPSFYHGSAFMAVAAALSAVSVVLARRHRTGAGRRWCIVAATLLSVFAGPVGLWGFSNRLFEMKVQRLIAEQRLMQERRLQEAIRMSDRQRAERERAARHQDEVVRTPGRATP